MPERYIGVLGATSLVGHALLPLLIEQNVKLFAFSRRPQVNVTKSNLNANINWHQTAQIINDASPQQEITDWICLAPIWVLADYFDWLKSLGAKRIVALSSTSRFTKMDSANPSETAIVQKLVTGEEKLIQWAIEHEVEWLVLRPTLIYGGGKDKNITVIARFIRRYRFFPLFGQGVGLRQPIHVDDVATACYQALNQRSVSNQAYNISGGEELTYREMVKRVFTTLGKKPRIVTLPLPILKIGLAIMKLIPRYRRLTSAMITRMNQDMVFAHEAASRDFGFAPRPFKLNENDLPSR